MADYTSAFTGPEIDQGVRRGVRLGDLSENEVPVTGASPDKNPVASGITATAAMVQIADKTFRTNSVEYNQAIATTSGVEEVCFSNMVRNTQSHPPLQRAEFSASDRVQNKVWAAAAVADQVRQAVDTETIVDPTFTLTADASGADGLRIASFQVNFAAAATAATVTVKRGADTVYQHNFGAFTTGVQRLSLMSDPGVAGEPGFVDVEDGDDYIFEVTGASLLGNTSNVPWYTLSFRTWNREDMARVSDVPTTAVELTDISSAGSGSIITATERTKLTGVADNATQGVVVQDEGTQVDATATTINFAGDGVTATESGGVVTVTIAGGGGGTPQADHTNYIDVTTDSNASSVDTANAVSSDDLNPTVTLETFTGNAYIQILQSEAHTAFTSIIISGINQIGGFTINSNARTISGQSYRQYVTTNLITDALSGVEVTLGGAT